MNKFTFEVLNCTAQSFLRDLQKYDNDNFPDIDLWEMSSEDKDNLVKYCRKDTESLTSDDETFLHKIADYLDNL